MSSMVIDWYLRATPLAPPSIFNFLIFASAFSIVSVLYLELAPRLAPRASRPSASLALEATNTVFYFAGFIALAVYISRLRFCEGTVCAVARATSVVAAFEFSSWIASTILLAKDIFKGGLRGGSPSAGSGSGSAAPADFDVVPQGLRPGANRASRQWPLRSSQPPLQPARQQEMRQV
ncbi:hypothetical protein ACRE_045260 [Hapsidospora chrysogenum ATCC 11550]|uniref:MARVEL domain-containing protein n=1 Tax=Hapsidospora chrysogenum (strain ATCC 11550 / CBS 779.69 / DSM 880 / IAM 14645 / JCM 23072 / IMI 49137) TaxID=857340 RepID=A0A086T5P4_HAPC1|nr:hypothetical protein ACRE_045260 [Hapsidospora chrysogenum ATCC 11550]